MLAAALAIGLISAACSGGSDTSGDEPAAESAESPADDAAADDTSATTEAPASPETTDPPATTAAPETAAAPTTTEGVDTDGDGEPDASDLDDDGDGVPDDDDLFPLNARRSAPLRGPLEIVDGMVELEPGPLAEQFAWVLAELRTGDGTTVEEIEEHFDPGYLANFDPRAVVNGWNQFRESWDGFGISDVLFVSPYRISTVVVHPNGVEGELEMSVDRDGSGGINFFRLAGTFRPESAADAYASLSVEETVDQLVATADAVSVLVARIDDDRCVALVEQNIAAPLETASMFKGYVLGAVADAVDAGDLTLDTPVSLDADLLNTNGSRIASAPIGTEFSLLEMATLMMALSDNTATDHLMKLIGRDELDRALERFGHAEPGLMSPLLTTGELAHLRLNVPTAEADMFATLSENDQRVFVDEVLAPLGSSTGDFRFVNDAAFRAANWRASADDLCRLMAGLRTYPDTTDASLLVDRAYGGGNVPAFARQSWERAWFKGGSQGLSAEGLIVLTLGYLVESDDRGTYVVITMANSESSVIRQDEFVGLTQRLLLAVEDGDIT